ncbi:hypothetical protein ACJ72_06808 [Emergomyces africanus]|uniref:TOM core complex subunit Tom6 n=1 Tax=Emergomyces africanus TaxID=1955775 RepID=A0A1B7NQ11_9EURO|nr:hypothetical protein ACJ72_06808 [Emergomyces africanus]
MAPQQRIVVQSGPAKKRHHQPESTVSAAYHYITSPDNASVLRSVVIFGAAVAFLHSSLSELLIPQ